MNERERLIELLKSPNKAAQLRKNGVSVSEFEADCPEAVVADHLLANGVIVPPCKVGDTVYLASRIEGVKDDGTPIHKIEQGYVHRIEVDNTKDTIWIGATFGMLYCCRPYTDFCFTKEEAEKALAERGTK